MEGRLPPGAGPAILQFGGFLGLFTPNSMRIKHKGEVRQEILTFVTNQNSNVQVVTTSGNDPNNLFNYGRLLSVEYKNLSNTSLGEVSYSYLQAADGTFQIDTVKTIDETGQKAKTSYDCYSTFKQRGEGSGLRFLTFEVRQRYSLVRHAKETTDRNRRWALSRHHSRE
jgi:hypothetical protein